MRRSRRRYGQAGWNALGLAVSVVMVFPVYWMVSTAFKPDSGIIAETPQWIPLHPTLDHFRDAMAQPYFWDEREEQPHHRARDRRDRDGARVPRRDRAGEVPLHAG